MSKTAKGTLTCMSDIDEPVQIVPYDPAWPGLGRDLVGQVKQALRAIPADVAHIGSTSVPGLAAKPVIDVQVGCAPGDVKRVVARLQRLGFEHLGQPSGPGRDYLRRRATVSPNTGPPNTAPANVSVVERGGRLWSDNIMFRDYLRAHPEAAARYAQVKLRAADEAGMLTAYSALKAATVTQIMEAARQARATGP